MDSLPLEMKLKIFNLLPIRDSIKCRQVCKEWLAIIDCLRYKSLDFCVSFNERSEERYFEKDIDLWILNFEKFFRSVTIDPKFGHIKVMNVIGHLSNVENLDVFINHFHELEELNLHSAPRVAKFALNLKSLKKLKFYLPNFEFITSIYELETPSLTHLIAEDLSNFEICYPEQIKCLVAKNTSSLAKFKNLEILIIIDHPNEICQLSADLLHRLTQLKRVYLGYEWRNMAKRLDQIPIDRNSELQVYCYGFRINSDLFGNFDWTMVKAKRCNETKWTSFMARNYSKSIDDNPYDFNLDYNCLLDEFDQNIPNEFFKKISNFFFIRIKNLGDEMKILKFLDSNEPMVVLFKSPTLSRSFLVQLSKFSFICYLIIRIDEWPSFLDDFNFDFKNEKIKLVFEIHCSLKSLRPVFKVSEKARSIRLKLEIFCGVFSFILTNFPHSDCSEFIKSFIIVCDLNNEHDRICCLIESFDFCFYLDRQVPSIVELEDKLRLFSIVKEYEAQRKFAEKVKRELFRNATKINSIKF